MCVVLLHLKVCDDDFYQHDAFAHLSLSPKTRNTRIIVMTDTMSIQSLQIVVTQSDH